VDPSNSSQGRRFVDIYRRAVVGEVSARRGIRDVHVNTLGTADRVGLWTIYLVHNVFMHALSF
jgi:hypothetical protein